MRLTLNAFLSLDGVVQAPGGSEEDRDGQFEHGGWTFPYGDEQSGALITRWFGNAGAFLLGRRTYDIFAAYWPLETDPANPLAGPLNTLPKYVASTTLRDPAWANTQVLGPDVPAEVAALKAQPGGELQVHGSGGLAQTLIARDLIDEYRLLTFPVHLGSGRRLFRDGTPAAALRLTSAVTTPTGVIIATYEPDGAPRYGTIGAAES
jgi:dihydrofolate reductase